MPIIGNHYQNIKKPILLTHGPAIILSPHVPLINMIWQFNPNACYIALAQRNVVFQAQSIVFQVPHLIF